jgi:hypothetical protein
VTKKPPPPKLVRDGSATTEAKPAAMTASKALPPWENISDAAFEVRGCPDETTPLIE